MFAAAGWTGGIPRSPEHRCLGLTCIRAAPAGSLYWAGVLFRFSFFLEERVPRKCCATSVQPGCGDRQVRALARVQLCGQTYRQREVQKDFHFPKPLCFVRSSPQTSNWGEGSLLYCFCLTRAKIHWKQRCLPWLLLYLVSFTQTTGVTFCVHIGLGSSVS